MFSSTCSQSERSLIDRARAFAAEAVAPVIEHHETERRVPVDLLRAGAAEFAGLLVPEKEGGDAAGIPAVASVLAALARADLAFTFSLVVHLNLTSAIARRGSAAQKQKYLGDMLSGRLIGAFCLTEPDAGTDAAALSTTARRDQGANWTLNGEKAWITNGAVADLFCVYAGTDTAPGSKGIASFLIDRDRAGMNVQEPYALMGGNVMGTTGLSLDACHVESDQLFVPPGEGFKAAMQGIDLARILLSSMCCAVLADGLDIASTYARNRRAFGQRTIDFQGLQFSLAEVASDLRAAQLLTGEAIRLLDAGDNARLAASHAKKMATRAAFDGLAQCMQAMGANGFKRDHALPRHLANAKMAHYLDGTTEVQNLIIGREIAREPGMG